MMSLRIKAQLGSLNPPLTPVMYKFLSRNLATTRPLTTPTHRCKAPAIKTQIPNVRQVQMLLLFLEEKPRQTY